MNPTLEKIARLRYQRSPWYNQVEVPSRAAPLMTAIAWDKLDPEARSRMVNEVRLDLAGILPPSPEMVEKMLSELTFLEHNDPRSLKAEFSECAFTAAIRYLLDEGEG